MRQVQIIVDGKVHTFSGPAAYDQVPAEMILPLLSLIKRAQRTKGVILAIPALIYKMPQHIWRIFFHSRAHHRYISLEAPEDPDSLTDLGLQLLETCRWTLTEPPPGIFIKKKIRIGKDIFYAPADRLTNITFGEFVLSQTYVHRDHAKLAALLYRRGSWGLPYSIADARSPFREEIVGANAKNFFSGPEKEEIRTYIHWNYLGCINAISKGFRHVFQEKQKTGDNTATQPLPAENPFMESVFALAQDDTGRYNDLLKANVYVVLKILNDRIKRNKELEAKYPSKKTRHVH